MKRAEAAVIAFRAAQELRPDIRSYQGGICITRMTCILEIIALYTFDAIIIKYVTAEANCLKLTPL